MAVRQTINNKVKNGYFDTVPPFTAATTSNDRVVDGTAGGSATSVQPSFNKQKYVWKMNTYTTTSPSVQYENGGIKVTGIQCKERVNLTNGNRIYPDLNDPLDIKNNLIPVLPNTSYTCTVKMKTLVANAVGTPGTYGAMVNIYRHSGTAHLGTEFITNTSNSDKIAVTTEWTTYTKTFTTSASTTYVNIYFGIFGDASNYADMTAWFDDIRLDTTVPSSRTSSTPRTLATNRVAVRDMGTALRFNATAATNQVAVTHNSVFTFGRTCSVSCWFRPSSIQNDAALISKGIGSATPIDIRYSGNNGTVGTYVYDGTFQSIAQTPSSKRLLVGRDYFITSVTDTNFVTLYINGLVAATVANTTVGTTDNTTNITFGNRTGSTKWIDGIIDEPRIWNRALTATEVANMYFNNVVPRTGLVGEWLFNETTGTTALDSSGNGNDGTITGATYTTDVPLRTRTSI